MSLSPVQERIVNTKGNLIVRASAGTGKTHTMAAKIAKEINDNKTHKVVAAITFTIKAAQEIKDRLSVDISQHFIGTNNSFAIEEIIKPFMKDVYGSEFDKDMSTDYSIKLDSFTEAIEKIRTEGLLCSYKDNKENFIFELALKILMTSTACKLYLISKYFKIYIDEYQDCDKDMHKLFMYICDKLAIETFVVGDEKQSIYIWRGAYPQAFVSIKDKPNFKTIFMSENHRSCQQIQNYSNLLCPETRKLYTPLSNLNSIIYINATDVNWAIKAISHLDFNKRTALLRYSHNNARLGADELTNNGFDFVYIPVLPIADISTNAAWLYMELAKYIIIHNYSVYDFISEIPVEGDESKKAISVITKLLYNIKKSILNETVFYTKVNKLADYLGYQTSASHLSKLYKTVSDSSFHVAFNADNYKNIAITFHSSKGLEFDQVIIFAEDYDLSKKTDIFNHYVAVTRAKTKLIIISKHNFSSNSFQRNIRSILKQSGLILEDVLIVE